MTTDGSLDTGTVGPKVDYKSSADSGWYTVRLVLQNELLIVKYVEFSDAFDERFSVREFSSLDEIVSFRQRFRLPSRQVQDSECSVVKEGMVVCGCCVYDGQCLFHDAVVEKVRAKEHSFSNGEECSCDFMVSWVNGSRADSLSLLKIKDICFIQTSPVLDPRLTLFLKRAEQAVIVGIASCDLQNAEAAKLPATKMCKTEDIEGMEIADLRRETNSNISRQHEGRYFFLVDNLEKDVTPSAIVSFIHEQTAIFPEAYVFPSWPSEVYTRGALLVDSMEKSHMLHKFLSRPDVIITSSRGRPWVLSRMEKTEVFEARFGRVKLNLKDIQEYRQIKSEELKVVLLGSDEYLKAKRLRFLFSEFTKHLGRLHTSLALKEDFVLQSSDIVC